MAMARKMAIASNNINNHNNGNNNNIDDDNNNNNSIEDDDNSDDAGNDDKDSNNNNDDGDDEDGDNDKGILITHLSSWILTCIQVANPPYQNTTISHSIPISNSHNFSNVLSTMRS
jgi:hypothetical protein